MSKPRWIDGGVFRTLRTATRKRRLAVVVGPRHGSAEIASRQQLREALGENPRETLAEDARFHSEPDAGLAALHALSQPGVLTTAVCDALRLSAPGGGDKLRVYGPDCRGLRGAYDRKDPFLVHLCGSAADPGSLVLTQKERKTLLAPKSRYRDFLRETFSRTVLFTGFALDDPDLIGLLEDVGRVFNGHVPANIALVPAGSTDPSTQLRASMHYAMSIVEFPGDRKPSDALAQVANVLEELEVPRPPTGNPPRGFLELTPAFREQVPKAEGDGLAPFESGDSEGWGPFQAGADVPRTVAGQVTAPLLGPAPEERVPVVLVCGEAGQGKTTLLRRLAWDLAEGEMRIFWREPGVGLPERYVPAEDAGARACFVSDDAHELDSLPALLAQLAGQGGGKVRFLLATEPGAWERSGLDHRIQPSAQVTRIDLGALDETECQALAARLHKRGLLPKGVGDKKAAQALAGAEGCLMDRMAAARGRDSVRKDAQARLAELEDERLRRAWLAVATVHRFGMSLGRGHLARLLDTDEDKLSEAVLGPLAGELVGGAAGALRTPHPLVAGAVCSLLAPDDTTRFAMASDLLASLPGGSTDDTTVFHAPSELIRAVRHDGPMGPLTLEGLFKTGENAADHDLLYWLDRGRHQAEFSRWEEALRCLDRALRRQPGDSSEKEHNAVVQAHRARCLLGLGRKRAALTAIDEGLRASPNNGTLMGLRHKLGGGRPRTGRGGKREGGAGKREGGGGREGRRGPPRRSKPPAGAGRQT